MRKVIGLFLSGEHALKYLKNIIYYKELIEARLERLQLLDEKQLG